MSVRWTDVDRPLEETIPNLRRVSVHWIYPVGARAVVHLRQRPGIYGPWEATLEQSDGTVITILTHPSVAKVQAAAEAAIWSGNVVPVEAVSVMEEEPDETPAVDADPHEEQEGLAFEEAP